MPAELDLLNSMIGASSVLLEVVKIIKGHYEKKRVRKMFWDLIERDADRYKNAYDNLIRILGKMIGYAVFLSADEYKKELDKLTEEFDENLGILINSMYKIVESIAIHKDTLKTVLNKEDWLIIEHVSSAYTDGDVDLVKLTDPRFVKVFLGENEFDILPQVFGNLLVLFGEINEILKKHGLEIFIEMGEKFRNEIPKYMDKIIKCIYSDKHLMS